MTPRRAVAGSAFVVVTIGVALLAALLPAHAADGGVSWMSPDAPVAIGEVPDGIAGTSAAACGQCHRAEYEEWRSSLHASSFTNQVFVEQYAAESRDSCRHCHAPLGPEREPSPQAIDEGVSCAVCHVRGGRVLATRVSGHAPHESALAPELGESRFCASCHDFDFPADMQGGVVTHEPLQTTFREWQASTAARDGATCQSCHVREVAGGRRSHSFPGAHDDAMLRDAAEVVANYHVEHDVVRVDATLTPRAIGHAFPTGDLLREVALAIDVTTTGSFTHELRFGRTFRSQPERSRDGAWHAIRREHDDTRVAAPDGVDAGRPRHLSVRVTGEVTRVAYRLLYRVKAPGSNPHEELYGREVTARLIREGEVTPRDPSPTPTTSRSEPTRSAIDLVSDRTRSEPTRSDIDLVSDRRGPR